MPSWLLFIHVCILHRSYEINYVYVYQTLSKRGVHIIGPSTYMSQKVLIIEQTLFPLNIFVCFSCPFLFIFVSQNVSICPFVFSCKMLVKVIFLFIPSWKIVVMRKKGIAFFSNSGLNPKWSPCFLDIIYFNITFEIMNTKTCIIY